MLSLRHRLPLLIATLLAIAVSVVCWLSYRQAKGVLLEATGTRLDAAARLVAGMLDESLRRMRTDAQARAADPAVHALLRRPAADTRDAAERALWRDAARVPTSRMTYELWSADGRLLLASGPLADSAAGDVARDAPRTVGIGPIVPTTEGMLYTIVAPALGADGDTLGRLAVTRSLAGAQGIAQIEELIGSRATLLVGSVGGTGGRWTNFRGPVAGPPAPLATGELAEFALAGEARLGVSQPLRSAPWLVLVHGSRALAVAPARRFVLDIVAIALVLVGLGALGTWIVSRQVTAPLAEVTGAARDVARGDYARRVPVGRRDELGSLATSFNAMAEQIQASARRLHDDARELETANARLRASEERYRQLVDAAHEGICVVDPTGTITYANRRLAALLGHAAGALEGRTIFTLMDAETAFEARTQFARRARGIAETHEVPLRRVDGSIVWTHMASSSLFDADGTFTGALLMVGDVTEAHAAREELARSERQFRALTEHASDLTSVIDADGRVRYASPAHERFIGFTPAELEGAAALEHVHPDDVGALATALEELRQRPRARAALQFRHRHRDGTWRTFASVATNLLDDPAVGGVVVNSHDVTDQRALEAQLRQAQKMEAVGQLAGGIAHDFNNLLTVIGSYSEFLLADLPPDSPMRADVDEIRAAARRASNLTRQLLAFSRQQVLAPRRMDLGIVVRGMTEMLQRMVGADIRLEARLAPGLADCFADPGQFEHVLMNLVVNARDAMPDGGRLTIETANVVVDAAGDGRHGHLAPGAYVMLAVSDTGVGMDEATQARAFEPFFTTKGVGRGTGLGLSTVYGIVQQSGGAITVDSAPGVGTAISVFLPVAAADADDAARGATLPPGATAATRPTPSHPAATPARGVVLVVDDEEPVRDVVCRTLAQEGHTVLLAVDGAEALALLEDLERRIDLVVSDVTMPLVGGVPLVEHLARSRPGTRAVLMSGFTADELLRRGTLPANVLFLSKPFTQDALARTVNAALRDAAGMSHPGATPGGSLAAMDPARRPGARTGT